MFAEGARPRHFVRSFARETFHGVESERGSLRVEGGNFWVGEKLAEFSSKDPARVWCEFDVDDLMVVLATYGDVCGEGELNEGV